MSQEQGSGAKNLAGNLRNQLKDVQSNVRDQGQKLQSRLNPSKREQADTTSQQSSDEKTQQPQQTQAQQQVQDVGQQTGKQAQDVASQSQQAAGEAGKALNSAGQQVRSAVSRPYQVVVWGASGFTGKLVCENIAKHYKTEVRWAMAGRSKSKVEKVRQDLEKYEISVKDVPIITATIDDPKSLDDMTSQCQVLINVVGPYAKYATPVVESCLRSSTHMLDLTGELHWVKMLIDKYQHEAERKGVKIINCCGFEVVPMDMLAFIVADHAQSEYKTTCQEIVINFSGASGGGVSGGTIDSIAGIFDDKKNVEALKDVYCLTPKDSKKTPHQEKIVAEYSPIVKSWVNSNPAQLASNRTFRRANYVQGYRYGVDVKYNEYINVGYAPIAYLVYFFMQIMLILVFNPLFQTIMYQFRRFLPAAGSGPSRAVMTLSSWKLLGYGVFTDPKTNEKKKITASIQGHHDAGYYDTSIMMLETAMSQILSQDLIRTDTYLPRGGVMTPAPACGRALIERLNQHQINLKIDRVDVMH